MSFFNSIKKRLLNYYWFKNNSNYITYLRSRGVTIGNNVRFRYPKHTTIDLTRPTLVSIGNEVDINDNFTIMTHDFSTFVFRNLFKDFVGSSGAVKIGNNVYIGRDVTILKGVSIGNNCIIGLGSIVTKDIPDNTVSCGVPCKVICSIEDYYKRRKTEYVNEAIEYGISIMRKYNREITPNDCIEEWSTFLTKKDYENYRDFRIEVDKRLNNSKYHLVDEWFANNNEANLPFKGFSDYKNQVEAVFRNIEGL